MSSGEKLLILIADDSEVSREYLGNILVAANYDVIKAVDGGSALKVLAEQPVALAVIDHHMQPLGGLEFAKNLRVRDINIPMIMVTSEVTSDLLVETTKYGIGAYLKKPVDPARFVELIRRYAKSIKQKDGVLSETQQVYKSKFSPDELMNKVIDMARNNVRTGHGGPFAAIVTDAEGNILGEGVNGIASRSDPVAHAEVMAIRQATEKLSKTSLEDCVLYSTSEPTRVGKALINSVGIAKVYFGLTYVDLNNFLPRNRYENAEYMQLGQEAALEMLSSIKA